MYTSRFWGAPSKHFACLEWSARHETPCFLTPCKQNKNVLLLLCGTLFHCTHRLYAPRSLSLPQTLRDSIRLRLARVAESDEHLDTLLKLACVMGGSFTIEAVGRAWSALDESGTDVQQLPGSRTVVPPFASTRHSKHK